MSAYYYFAVIFIPLGIIFLNLMSLAPALSRACRIAKADEMHKAPEKSDTKMRKRCELIVKQVPLMPVHDKYFLSRFRMNENECLIYCNSGKQINVFALVFIIDSVKRVLYLFGIRKFYVVVTEKHIKSSIIVKPLEPVKCAGMRIPYVLEFRTFKKLIAIADLHISEPLFIVIAESEVLYVLISAKIVRKSVITAMYIAEKHEF